MPLERGLRMVICQLPTRIAQTAEQVSLDLESGQSLSRAIAADPRPSSRSLAATFTAGVKGNCLSQSLQSWMRIHTNHGRFISRLRISLIYPVILILVAAGSIGFSIHHSIPLYRSMLESANQPMPVWFDMLSVIQSTLWLWVPMCVVIALSLTFIIYYRQANALSNGVPFSLPYRLRLQSHASRTLAWLLEANLPFETSKQLAIESTGISMTEDSLETAKRWHPISINSSSILTAIARGEMEVNQANEALVGLADVMNRQADLISERQLRWLPIASSVAIAAVALVTYLVVIYLPWIYLLTKLSLPSTR